MGVLVFFYTTFNTHSLQNARCTISNYWHVQLFGFNMWLMNRNYRGIISRHHAASAPAVPRTSPSERKQDIILAISTIYNYADKIIHKITSENGRNPTALWHLQMSEVLFLVKCLPFSQLHFWFLMEHVKPCFTCGIHQIFL